MVDKYTNLTKEQFDQICSRYKQFQDHLNDVSNYPVRVFEPLSAKSLADLHLIREVSKDLQDKKDEDIRKAAAKEAAYQEEKEKSTAETEATEVEKKD